MSDEFSVDFAALYLADQITNVPVNRRFRIAFDQAYNFTRKDLPQDHAKLPVVAADYEVLIVPIYLYKRLIGSGADLAPPRAALEKVGLTCHFVETQDDGAVETNADLVADAIRARMQSGRRLIIMSASKSGPEVALALTTSILTVNWCKAHQTRVAILLPTLVLGSSLRLRPGLCFAVACSEDAFGILRWNHSLIRTY